MLVGAWADGVGSNWVGFGGLEAVKPLLDIPAALDVLAILPFGYPARSVGRGKKQRKALREGVHLERYGRPFEGGRGLSVDSEIVGGGARVGAAGARRDESVSARGQRSARPDPIEAAAVSLGADLDQVLAAQAARRRRAGVGHARAAADLQIAVGLAGIEADERHLAGLGGD